MRIYLDLDSRRLLTTPTRPLSLLEFKRRDNDSIELQFLRDAAVQELPAGTTARVGIKPSGDYDAAFLAVATLTQSGTGTATFYSGELNLHTTAMAAAFADEPVTISAMLEVEWVTGDVVSSSRTLPTTIHNDVIRGDEGDQAELPIFYTAATIDFQATQAQAESGTDNVSWMSPLRTAQAIAALAATDWDSIADKPATFPPATHTHTIGEVTGLQDELDALAEGGGGGGVSSYNDLTDVPSTFPPEAHTHAISEVTGLQTAIDGKAAATHTHAIADTTGLQAALDGKQAAGSYASATHTHAATDITSGTLAFARIPTGTTSTTVCIGNDARLSDSRTPTAHTHAIADTTGLQTALDGKQTAGSYVTTSGSISTIAVVASLPATPDPTTLYIVTA